MKRGLEPGILIKSSLINGYCKVGDLRGGFLVCQNMLKDGYGVLLSGHSELGQMDLAMRFFFKSVKLGFWPKVFAVKSLVDGWCRLKNMRKAIAVLQIMNSYKIIPDVITFGTLINGITVNGRRDIALLLFQMLKRGLSPDVVTYSSLIIWFSKARKIDFGLQILKLMLGSGVSPDINVYNVVLNILLLQGQLESARELFRKLPNNGLVPDIVTYNKMAAAHCKGLRKQWNFIVS